ncbi:MAG: ATPase [Candidatus Azobacteroides sp.]|nr:ATPase [Candidatus Azobacteroides sp.]
MILLADSGSTKTHWSLVQNGLPEQEAYTSGINPFYQSREEIEQEIESMLLPQIDPKGVEHVYFYGAGCIPEKTDIVKQAIKRFFACPVEVNNDLLAACHALAKRLPGIVCILGTGSNSCLYDGEKIVQHVSPLGFILGDEGSGATLGKLLVADVLKNQLPKYLRDRFFARFNLTPSQIMDQVYRNPFPNRFLASLSVFIKENMREEHLLQSIVEKSFAAFFHRNVSQYGHSDYPVHFSGSVAYHYENILKEVADDFNMQIGKIEMYPMNGLIEYHTIK